MFPKVPKRAKCCVCMFGVSCMELLFTTDGYDYMYLFNGPCGMSHSSQGTKQRIPWRLYGWKEKELASTSKHTVTANNNIGCQYVPISNGVNSKSGRYLRSLSLLAVFLNWPSERLVSKLYSPSKPTAPTMASATSLMETSSFSPT